MQNAFTATASYDYDANTSSYNSSYASRTVSFAGQTDRDDFLLGRTQVFNIWRYRVYGAKLPAGGSAAPPNAYYEVVLPGPVEKIAGGGQSFDWYQPLHENGNILSYSVELQSSFRIRADGPDYKPRNASVACNLK